MLGIQDLVLDPLAIKHPGDQFAPFNRHRADEDRAALALDLADRRAGDRLAAP